MNGAWRSLSSGLPYWPRLKLYMKASYVPLLNVQFALEPIAARGRLALVERGEVRGADRLDGERRDAEDERRRAREEQLASGARVCQRTSSTASPTAGAASMPAMWLA